MTKRFDERGGPRQSAIQHNRAHNRWVDIGRDADEDAGFLEGRNLVFAVGRLHDEVRLWIRCFVEANFAKNGQLTRQNSRVVRHLVVRSSSARLSLVRWSAEGRGLHRPKAGIPCSLLRKKKLLTKGRI